MVFVAIGFIILFISFLVALVFLIKEQGSRPENEDILVNFGFSELADEVVPVKSESTVELASSQAGNMQLENNGNENTSNLDEVVPFPWEMESDAENVDQNVFEKPQGSEIIPRELNLGAERDNLYGEISLSDLANK